MKHYGKRNTSCAVAFIKISVNLEGQGVEISLVFLNLMLSIFAWNLLPCL